MTDGIVGGSVLDFSTQDLLCAIKEISIILARFKNKEELVEFIKSLDFETGAETGKSGLVRKKLIDFSKM